MSPIFIGMCRSGETTYARTNSAEYWFVIRDEFIADVYRKGTGKDCAVLLGRRKIAAILEVNEGYMMWDGNDEPLAAIIPTEVQKVHHSQVPLRAKEVILSRP